MGFFNSSQEKAIEHLKAGHDLLDSDKIEAAISQYRESLRHAPGLAAAHTSLGVALERKGAVDEAIEAHKRALELTSDQDVTASAYCNLGYAYIAAKLFDGAVEQFTKAIALNTKLVQAHNGLAFVLGSLGRLEEAEKTLQEACALDPENRHGSRAGLEAIRKLRKR